MIFHPTKIHDIISITLEPKTDERGYFSRVFCKNELKTIHVDFEIVQINQSLTKKKGTIRGIHIQKNPKMESKIVSCLQGAIYDVAVDLRKDSPTFGKWVCETLSKENRKMLVIPKGFAHGFQTLEENTIVQYFMDEYYAPGFENGVRWNDPYFNIQWPIKNPELAGKDIQWPLYTSS